MTGSSGPLFGLAAARALARLEPIHRVSRAVLPQVSRAGRPT